MTRQGGWVSRALVGAPVRGSLTRESVGAACEREFLTYKNLWHSSMGGWAAAAAAAAVALAETLG